MKANPCQFGWIRAISDVQIGVAFQRMHEKPADPWTVETLAHSAGMSRAAFAARFKEVLGIGPLAYLTRLRVRRATAMLDSPSMTVAAVAAAVGYADESAFTKVFKRVMNETPGTFRRRTRAGVTQDERERAPRGPADHRTEVR